MQFLKPGHFLKQQLVSRAFKTDNINVGSRGGVACCLISQVNLSGKRRVD